MLFAPPTLTSGPCRPVAPTAEMAPVSGLGVFSSWIEALGTALRSTNPKTVVRSGFHGWLAERQPVIFQAERKKLLGTVLLSPINPRVRAVFHGWLTARHAGHFPSEQEGSLGTATTSVHHSTVVRSAFHGWLAGRQPVIFQAERKKLLGTVLLSPINPRVRAVFHGWLTARHAGHFPSEQEGSLGTATASVHHSTVVRSAFHGWLAGRQPVIFQAERKKLLGTVLLSPINPRVRAVFHGWLTARHAGHFPIEQEALLGTAVPSDRNDTVVRSGFHGWLAGRRPVAFMSAPLSQGGASGSDYHVSVLPQETAEWMEAGPEKFIIDGTLGGGGHSEAFLETGARVLGVDRDPEALAHASKRLSRFGARFRTWQGNFADLRDNPEVQGGERADGLLLDLGVSSRQLDAPERGFSFRGDGPLDMRMGPATELTAATVVNEWPEDEILRILREYGEEPKARRIAAAIVQRRAQRPFETTLDLANHIEKEIGRFGKTHPATRSFQAIRIAVNDELGSLERALEASVDLLKPGGKLLVITFHSLEDRMVKRFMQDRAKPFIDKPHWPEPRPNPRWAFTLPRRKAIAPSDQEIRINTRARSAKLRVAELLDPTTPRP